MLPIGFIYSPRRSRGSGMPVSFTVYQGSAKQGGRRKMVVSHSARSWGHLSWSKNPADFIWLKRNHISLGLISIFLLLVHCSIVDFFKEMPQFCIKVAHILTGLYGSDWEKKLEVHISVLPCFRTHFRRFLSYYWRAFPRLCSVEGTASERCPFKLAKQVKLYFLLLFVSPVATHSVKCLAFALECWFTSSVFLFENSIC